MHNTHTCIHAHAHTDRHNAYTHCMQTHAHTHLHVASLPFLLPLKKHDRRLSGRHHIHTHTNTPKHTHSHTHPNTHTHKHNIYSEHKPHIARHTFTPTHTCTVTHTNKVHESWQADLQNAPSRASNYREIWESLHCLQPYSATSV